MGTSQRTSRASVRPAASALAAAVVFLFVCMAPPSHAAGPSPRMPGQMSWTGVGELAGGGLDAALAAVLGDTGAGVDTLLRLYKLGAINARLGMRAEALSALNAVNRGSPALAPLAMEQIGDLAVAAGEGALAVAAYASALKAANLPAKYRRHLFSKIKPQLDRGASVPTAPSWLEEYKRWARAQRLFDAAGLEAVCDSLVGAGRLAEADSMLERYMPDIDKKSVCRFVERVFKKRSADTALVTTKFLFSLAKQSAECRNFATAERMLSQAQGRADFAAAVPAKESLRLLGGIAFGREQWQKAIDCYKKHDAAYGSESEVLMNLARAYRSLDQGGQAQAWYDRHVERFPNHQKTQEILWLRAWNHEEAGDYKSAAAGYRRVFGTRGKRTDEAYLRHALCYYRRGLYDSASAHLEAFKRKFPQSDYVWAGMFWNGKSLAAMGRKDDAFKVWGDISRLDPTDYYAHRARQLMGADSAGLFAAQGAALADAARVRAWLDSTAPWSKKKLTAKDSVDMFRGAALLMAARPDVADMFLDRFESGFNENLQIQYDLACAYAMAGSKALSFRVARRLGWRIPMDSREKRPLQVLSVLYPPFYRAEISRYAARFGVDPMLVIAVMRQESIFDREIVSPAGAIGLMQVMPATGESIALELKEAFAEESLYNYETSIRYGAFYLQKRLAQFNGDKVLALCSYNAGAHNAVRWRDRNRHLEFDLFVEDIGFFETRGYVKKVMGNYWTYKELAKAPGYGFEVPEADAGRWGGWGAGTVKK
jgi:soluble lytic murein transglycosylase-like protein/predicted negative regulator of RcsB-dependent stress response